MEKINIRRTLELMRYDLTINRKRYLTSLVLVVIFTAGFMLWAMRFAMHANMEGQVDIDSRSELFVIMTGTTLCYTSLAFLLGLLTQVHDYVLCDKQSRQAFFMLPVTNAERFVSRQLTAVLFLLAMPVLIALARLVSLAFLPLLGSVNAEAVSNTSCPKTCTLRTRATMPPSCSSGEPSRWEPSCSRSDRSPRFSFASLPMSSSARRFLCIHFGLELSRFPPRRFGGRTACCGS